MTGHKDFKLANHYSRLDKDFQKEVSEKIMEEYRQKLLPKNTPDNVVQLFKIAES